MAIDLTQEREALEAQRTAMIEFCKANLAECCTEMIEWSATAVLRNGKVRQLAKLAAYGGHNALAIAEAEVKFQAMQRAALAQSPVSTQPDPFAWIIARNSDSEWDGGSPMMDKADADYYLATECLPGFHLEPIYRAAPVSVEGLERDAARYRWLRDKSEPGVCAFYLSVGKAFHEVKFKPETVDDAIDAQIAAANKGTTS